MNTLAWVVAMVGSISMSYLFFTEYTGATFELIGWMCVALTMFCIAMAIDALMDDIQSKGGFGE